MFSSRTKLIMKRCKKVNEETCNNSSPDTSSAPSLPPEYQDIFSGLDSDEDPPYFPSEDSNSSDYIENAYLLNENKIKRCKKNFADDQHNTSEIKSGEGSSKHRPTVVNAPQEEREPEEDQNNVDIITQEVPEAEVPQELLLGDEINQQAVEVASPNPTNKQKRNKRKMPETWVKNIRKKKRNSGQEYKTTTGQIAPSKSPKPACGNCGLRCPEKVDEDGRKVLCEAFWSFGDINKQRDYICRMIDKHAVKRPRQNESRRKHSISYSFQYNGANHRVCKQFFLNTLCISEKKLRVAIVKGERAPNSVPSPDKRGKHTPPNKAHPEKILHMEAHIDSFPRVPAHWCRKDTKKEYLQAKLNKEKMYELYEEHCKETNMVPLKKTMYKEKLIAKNIGFFTPRKDQCWCHNYEQLKEEDREERREEYEMHTHRKNLANSEKDADKELAKTNPSVITANFDLQAVLYCPIEYKKPVFYKRKFATFNFTVYEVGKKQGHCFVWDESNGKRGSNEIATCLHKFINSLPITCKRLILYSDCCPGQNRNSIVAGMLHYAIEDHSTLESVELKFLEPGHTHMECDSMHAAIEHSSEHAQIYWPNEWINVIKLAKKGGNPYIVNRLGYEEFLDFKSYSSEVFKNKKIAEDLTTLKWTDVKCLKFIKGEKDSLFFKTEFWEDYRKLNVTRVPEASTSNTRTVSPRLASKSTLNNDSIVSRPTSVPKPVYSSKIPITSAKYKDLQDLCVSKVIPDEYHGFYSSLAQTTGQTTAEDDYDDELELTLVRSAIKNKKRKATHNK